MSTPSMHTYLYMYV
ncbi:hypothetical protein F383_03978 [Gossypium arboreum]|uniref:Uncharacterized protein n=1 Tax=Gossypium arboreum TaxID=29729 RepID=A0A0B0NZ58_GOSAR|nr:hypothetical protein F383_03978 [Gossypium arboreum]